jgi:hypothetical protein
MDGLLSIFKDYGIQLSVVGAAITFVFSVYKFQAERKAAHFWKEFEVYHKLVKELVEPTEKDNPMFIDRQAAIIYELRNFKRYYPYSLRMLRGLRQQWTSLQVPRLLEELDLTIVFLEGKERKGDKSRLFAFRTPV